MQSWQRLDLRLVPWVSHCFWNDERCLRPFAALSNTIGPASAGLPVTISWVFLYFDGGSVGKAAVCIARHCLSTR